MPARPARKARSSLFRREADELINRFSEQRPIRAGSLIISVFGDAITPHGGAVWLGSLIDVLEPFGINQRLVRTSVFRLAKDGWLRSEQIGRRSYYRLSESGRARFQDASRHIYSEPRNRWDGHWCLVMLAGADAVNRDDIRRELRWLGFGSFSANVLAHPAPDMEAVNERLATLAGNDKLLIMRASAEDDRKQYLRSLASSAWSLDDLERRYHAFLKQFRPVYKAASKSKALDNDSAFQVRTLMIHEYRKILLRDPVLPDELLPTNWSGGPAYQLCRNNYSLLADSTEEFLTERLETADGPLPPAEPSFYDRFGGLHD